MSKRHPSTAPKPAAHLKMIADMIERGFIKRVGDSYEITPEGHAHTSALTAELTATSGGNQP